MSRISKSSGRLLLGMILMLLFLPSTTGCAKPSVVIVPGSKLVTVTAEELDRLYSDNEHLLHALEACQKSAKGASK